MNYFNYFSDIESTFIRRRGKNLLLSPLDWTLMETWQEREIPLHIILRGIEDVFDAYEKNPPSKRKIKSLSYCKDEIEARHEEWLKAKIGKAEAADDGEKIQNPMSSNESIEAHLTKVLEEFESSVLKAGREFGAEFSAISKQISELKESEKVVEKLELSLERLDSEVDVILRTVFDTEELKAEISSLMVEYKGKMDVESYNRTFELMFSKRLREKHGFPRFSLYYL